MTSFFTILFIIVGLNAIMMFFSLSSKSSKAKKATSSESDTSGSKIYPIDLISSKYKKAV